MKTLLALTLALLISIAPASASGRGGVYLSPGAWVSQFTGDGGVNPNVASPVADVFFVSGGILDDTSTSFFAGVPIVPSAGAVMAGMYVQLAAPVATPHGTWLACGIGSWFVPRQWLVGTWDLYKVRKHDRTTVIFLGPKGTLITYWPVGQWLIPLKADVGMGWEVSGIRDEEVDLKPALINMSVSVPLDLLGSGALERKERKK